MAEPPDGVLAAKIDRLHREIITWARRNELWYDCGFFDYTERVRPTEWDGTGYVSVLAADGPIAECVISAGSEEGSLAVEFEDILKTNGFWYEKNYHTEMWIYATEPNFEQRFREYARWRWICSLIKPDFDILTGELYSYFKTRPDQLAALHWRDYEKLLAALLESQGYDVELGPGQNDGGVDIRLLQRDPLGDIMTLVQVKRNRPDRKVGLGAVQALHGATTADGAAKSMFITTSAYLPSAETFAGRENVPMTLYTSDNVQRWCAEACDGIVEDKRRLVSEGQVARVLKEARLDHRKILHTHSGYTMVANQFAIVLKETRTAALLLEVGTRITEHDGYRMRGREVPDTCVVPPLSRGGRSAVRRAKKDGDGAERRLWDGRNLYSPWNGNPTHFDHAD